MTAMSHCNVTFLQQQCHTAMSHLSLWQQCHTASSHFYDSNVTLQCHISLYDSNVTLQCHISLYDSNVTLQRHISTTAMSHCNVTSLSMIAMSHCNVTSLWQQCHTAMSHLYDSNVTLLPVHAINTDRYFMSCSHTLWGIKTRHFLQQLLQHIDRFR